MSVNIKIENAVKKYGNNIIIQGLNLSVKEGEFFTLLGPSGCGKTTLLRMIAGFNSIEGGDFYFNDTRINDLNPSLRNIGMVQEHLNTDLVVSTILLTMYDGRTKLAEQVANEVRNHFGDLVLRTTIPRSVKVSEAPGFGQSVMTYDPGSRGAMSYLDAAREIAERGTKEQA